MKKILVLVAVLAFIAGTAYAAALDDGLTRQVWSQAKGRSVVSDGSVAFRLWYVGSGTGTVSVSPSSVELYENGVNTSISFNTYGSMQRIVDAINNQTYWRAAVGPDLRPGEIYNATRVPIIANVTTAGISKQDPTYVYDDSSTRRILYAGIEATENKYNRIKTITSALATTPTTAATISVLVYDGDTIVWRKDIDTGSYNVATSPGASSNTISFINMTDKGLAANMGKALTVAVSANTAFYNGMGDGTKLGDHNVSLVYDQF